MTGEKRRLVTNTFLTGLSQSAAMIASLVFMPMLITAFGIGDYGLFMLVSSVTAYAALLDLGVGSALTKMVAEHEARHDRDALSSSISTTLVFYTAVGVVVALAMLAVGAVVDVVFDVDSAGALLLRNMLWLGAVFQLWFWPASTARYVIGGFQRYDILARTGFLATALNIIAIGLVLATSGGPLLLVALQGVTLVIVSIVNIAAARRLAAGVAVSPARASASRLRAIFVFSWAVFVVQLSDVLFYHQTDRILLGVFAGAVAVGLYEVAAKLNMLVTYLSGLTVAAVLPLASAMGAQDRHSSLRALFVRGTKYGAALVAPITIVLAVFAAPLLEVWLGPEFRDQAVVVQVLILPHVVVCLGLMGDAIVISKGRLAKRVPYVIAQTVFNIVLSIALIPRYGVLGVAVGTAAAHLIDFPLHIRFLLKETGVSLSQWMREIVLPVYPFLLLPAALSALLAGTFLVDTLAGVLVGMLIALFAYWLAVFVFGLSSAERAETRSAVTTWRSRVGQSGVRSR